MTLEYFNLENSSPLISEFFSLRLDSGDIPFQSTILPICYTTITNTFNNQHQFKFRKKNTIINGIILSGQFYESYEFYVNEMGHSYGISLHPTALYKLTNSDTSKIKNKHVQLKAFSKKLHDTLYPIFSIYNHDLNQLTQHVNNAILSLPIIDNATVSKIDKAVSLIEEKEGLLNIHELLEQLNLSQKTLETHFKRIIGLTPGKYVRLYRFIKLMRKYESKSIELNDLIYMYNYYDHSHFSKDFKHFMKQSPREYFKSEHPLLNKYLNK